MAHFTLRPFNFNTYLLSQIVGSGTQKALKAPCRSLVMDVGQARWTYAPRPSPGPHKLRESLPLTIFLRNRLKYALTGREVTAIVKQRLIKIDNKVRTDPTYPLASWSGEHFRLLYDVKGRFTIHPKGVPHIVTHDGRTIRYPDPLIKVNDTVKFDLEQNKITEFVKFDTGNIVMVTGGRNMGRAGVIVHREKHIGGFDIVTELFFYTCMRDSESLNSVTNIFVIGEGTKPWISLPKGKGTSYYLGGA
ncbi:40S ribosomal protein [Salix suchowensis]|nr:40S ribosomal protein [Salix suchowensis]